MIYKLGAFALCTAFVGTFAQANDPILSPAEKLVGWKWLFSGDNAAAFRNYKKDILGPGWKVENGELTRKGDGAGDIITREKFENFELSLEYKISKGGNSGLMFRVTEEGDAPWHTGPEVQIQDNIDGHDPQKSGWLYQMYSVDNNPFTKKPTDTTRPVGGWNEIRFICTRDIVELYMNGTRYWSAKIGSDDWNKRLAKSKFAQMAGFAKTTSGHICLQDHGNPVSFRNIKVRKLSPDGTAPEPTDGKVKVTIVPAFPEVQWTDWKQVDDKGKVDPLRPIIITHANDASGRIIVATQQGVIHIVSKDRSEKASKVFLDMSKKVNYTDAQNEEGFLGLAFHPDYKQTGEFFVYYSVKGKPMHCVLSRFRVSKDDPNRADPDFEEVLMEFAHPFWNHKGGTVAFGLDGMLYLAIGDGGAADDPFDNGQNLSTHLGKILRINVDKKDANKNYSVPRDNPFVDTKGAKPEIWAYGFRNIWRMAFDKRTGALFAADVGQNLFEEINIVQKGGNFGWNFREGLHPFGKKSPPIDAQFIDPIWEYDHRIGKSITGGMVYRGKAIPSLFGSYLYADYVSGKIWALDYDQRAKTVKGNHAIASPLLTTITFGEDEEGEAYFAIVSGDGKGIFKLVPQR